MLTKTQVHMFTAALFITAPPGKYLCEVVFRYCTEIMYS